MARGVGFSQLSIRGTVVPLDIQHPKRVAKYLQRFFRTSLGTSQHVTAHLLGHRDWHTLERAITRSSPSAPFDEQLLSTGATQHLIDRRQQQRDLLHAEMTDELWYNYQGARDLLHRICSDILNECQPSASQFPSPLSLYDCRLHPAPQSWMADFPARLAAWWTETVPEHLRYRADNLGGRWNKDRPSHVLAELSAWVDMRYRAKKYVDREVFEGAIGLFATQYALLRLLTDGQLQQHYQPVGTSKVVPLTPPLLKELATHVDDVLACFPSLGLTSSAILNAASSLYKRLPTQDPEERPSDEDETSSATEAADSAEPSSSPADLLPRTDPAERTARYSDYRREPSALAQLPRADYEQVARRYLEALDVPLSPELASAVVRVSIDRLFGLDVPTEVAAVLEENESWFWPALAAAYPPDRSFDPRSPWDYSAWRATSDAYQVERELTVSFKDWFWNEPITTIRAWQKQFLPAHQHARRKIEIQLQLLHLDPFPETIVAAFSAWKRDLASKLVQLREAAALPPVPRHLSFLEGLVSRRLAAWHVLVNSPEGPASFAPFEAAALSAARSSPVIDITAAEALVDAECDSHMVVMIDPKLIARSAKETLRKMLPVLESPLKLDRHLAAWRPAHLLVQKPCGCRSSPQVPQKEDKLPPFTLRCLCRDLTWKTNWEMRSRDDESFGACTQFDDRIEQWAIACLLGLQTPNFPYSHLSVKASSEEWHRQYEKERLERAHQANRRS